MARWNLPNGDPPKTKNSRFSDEGVPIEKIALLVGHVGGSDVTETVYRKQIRPVLLGGAEVMDRIFGEH
jgi:hypothetical protein